MPGAQRRSSGATGRSSGCASAGTGRGTAGAGWSWWSAGGGSAALGPLDADAVRRIALLYAPDGTAGDVPAAELLGVSRGVPSAVHQAASAWARREAAQLVVAFAPRAAAGRSELRAAEAGLAGGVVH